MIEENKGVPSSADWLTVLFWVLLVTVGWFSIYSSEYNEEIGSGIKFNMSHGKQIINIGISLVLILVVMLMDYRIFHTFAYGVYGFSIALLIVTLVLGKVVSGAKGWLQLGGFMLQTAEVAKLGTIMALAKLMSTYGVDIKVPRNRFFAFGLLALPILLVLLQNDTGSALVFLSLSLVMYRGGLNGAYILIPVYVAAISLLSLVVGNILMMGIIAAIGALACIFEYTYLRKAKRLILVTASATVLSLGVIYGVDYGVNNVLQAHQRERIYVTIGQNEDKDATWNVRQSLIAIGSGGLSGKGFLNGTQTKFKFVPEQSTDFIFCTVGEEAGFLGSLLVVVLFAGLLWRIIVISERQKSTFSMFYGYGVMAIILFHFTINIAMTMGIFPVIGIPLPFMSYGGSSLLIFTVMIFILLKLDSVNSKYSW